MTTGHLELPHLCSGPEENSGKMSKVTTKKRHWIWGGGMVVVMRTGDAEASLQGVK